jgi:rhodanese-related sulfurtransferase
MNTILYIVQSSEGLEIKEKKCNGQLRQLLFYNAQVDLNHWTPVKFIIEHALLIAIVVLSGGALLWPALTTRGKRVSPLEATQLINRGKATIVDVRDAAEFAGGHLIDAKNIPLKELTGRVTELEKFKSRTIIVVCQKGTRAGAAAAVLNKAGFTDVVCLEGGVAEWSKQALPLTKAVVTTVKLAK